MLEKVKDLAITYSVISDSLCKQRTFKRFKNLVEREYRDEAVMVAEHLRRHGVWLDIVNNDRLTTRKVLKKLGRRTRVPARPIRQRKDSNVPMIDPFRNIIIADSI